MRIKQNSTAVCNHFDASCRCAVDANVASNALAEVESLLERSLLNSVNDLEDGRDEIAAPVTFVASIDEPPYNEHENDASEEDRQCEELLSSVLSASPASPRVISATRSSFGSVHGTLPVISDLYRSVDVSAVDRPPRAEYPAINMDDALFVLVGRQNSLQEQESVSSTTTITDNTQMSTSSSIVHNVESNPIESSTWTACVSPNGPPQPLPQSAAPVISDACYACKAIVRYRSLKDVKKETAVATRCYNCRTVSLFGSDVDHEILVQESDSQHVKTVSEIESTATNTSSAPLYPALHRLLEEDTTGQENVGTKASTLNSRHHKRVVDHDSFRSPFGNSRTPTVNRTTIVSMRRFLELAHGASAKSLEELCERTHLEFDHVVKIQLESTTFRPAFYIAIDHETRSVALVVRGTKTVSDMLTNYTYSALTFEEGFVHKGMMKAATWFDCHVSTELISLQGAYPDYAIRLVGHSLGAGVTALYGLLLQQKIDSVEVVCFAPPACISSELLPRARKMITSIVNRDDFVPFLDPVNTSILANFTSKLPTFSWPSIGSKKDEKKNESADLDDVLEHWEVLNTPPPSLEALDAMMPESAGVEKLYPALSLSIEAINEEQKKAARVANEGDGGVMQSEHEPARRVTFVPPGVVHHICTDGDRLAVLTDVGSEPFLRFPTFTFQSIHNHRKVAYFEAFDVLEKQFSELRRPFE